MSWLNEPVTAAILIGLQLGGSVLHTGCSTVQTAPRQTAVLMSQLTAFRWVFCTHVGCLRGTRACLASESGAHEATIWQSVAPIACMHLS